MIIVIWLIVFSICLSVLFHSVTMFIDAIEDYRYKKYEHDKKIMNDIEWYEKYKNNNTFLYWFY